MGLICFPKLCVPRWLSPRTTERGRGLESGRVLLLGDRADGRSLQTASRGLPRQAPHTSVSCPLVPESTGQSPETPRLLGGGVCWWVLVGGTLVGAAGEVHWWALLVGGALVGAAVTVLGVGVLNARGWRGRIPRNVGDTEAEENCVLHG